jgi:NDP-sugar pyrophosphorylase family protein
VAFVAQSVGMDYVGPFTFNGTRCIIGGIVLIVANIIFDAVKKKNGNYKKRRIRGNPTLIRKSSALPSIDKSAFVC